MMTSNMIQAIMGTLMKAAPQAFIVFVVAVFIVFAITLLGQLSTNK